MSADLSAKPLLLVAALTLAATIPLDAHAQTARGAQAPESYALDTNSVDVVRGAHTFSVTDVAIGAEGNGLAYTRTVSGDRHRSTFDGLIEVELIGELSPGVFQWQYTVSIGPKTSLYRTSGSTLMYAVEGAGSTLEFVAPGTYVHTDQDGVVRTFSGALANPSYISPQYTPPAGKGGRIVQMTRPNGERWDWFYRSASFGTAIPVHRVQSVTNTFGYQVKFEYAYNGTPASDAELISFGTLTKSLGINNSVDWCDPAGDACAGLTQTWPQAQYATTPVQFGYRVDVTNLLGETTGYTYAGQNGLVGTLQRIDFPEPGRADLTLTYTDVEGEPRVAEYSDGRGTWLYQYIDVNEAFRDTRVTDPNGQTTQYRVRIRIGPPPGPMGDYTYMQRLNYMIDAAGARTDLKYGGGVQLTEVWFPEGNKVVYTRDGRGNITQMRRIAKPSAPAPDIIASWTYAATCTSANRPTCNQPVTATDPRGAITDYAYDPAHGGLLTETRPADETGVRPQTRYTYQPLQAWRRTSASATQVTAPAVVMPVQVSICASGTAPSCVGTAQEVRTTTTYQAGNVSTGSNLLPLEVTSGAGDGSLLATTTGIWNSRGDRVTVDGPLPGSADTTWYGYDALRRNVGVVAPDPDGSGPLPFPATRTLFNADGQPEQVEQGSATAQSDGALASMAVLSELVVTYDAQGRKTKDVQLLGTGTLGVTQYGYDDEGRLLCTAIRMDPANYGSLPGSACDLPATSGAFGEDRITRNGYDLADRLTTVTSALGTSVEQVARTQAWTPNGKPDWVQDANLNRSNHVYDGFDRLERLEFPLPAAGSMAANPNDYEAYAYDAADNLVSRRLRDGQVITFAYDALNRQTTKIVPGLGAADDVFTTYDLLDRRLTATFVDPGSAADGIAWTWDALGRPLTETSYGRTLTSTFDLAGRRTRLSWPSPFAGHADFGWDLAGRMTTAAEGPSAGAAATYAYDPLGRRVSLARAGAATTSWSYVPNSRDWSMSHDLAGGAGNDVTYALAFNPAGQAVSRDTSNPAYQFDLPTQAATPYLRDGLNQYDSVGGTAFAHDAHGNLTSDGVRVYGYDVENRLVGVYQGGVLQVDVAYDPLGRIKRTSTPTTVEQYLWDGDRLVGTFDGSSTPTGRWLHGPGPDEPLAQLSGARRWLLADHQGSITAETDAAGARVGAPYTYDPYGRPDAAHGFAGPRFRYTGQTALVPTVPLWHYKARVYDPGVGRFLQTDPIGYEDSLNLYQYVGNDPFNLTDPTGLCPIPPSSCGIARWADRQLAQLPRFGIPRTREDWALTAEAVGIGVDVVTLAIPLGQGPEGTIAGRVVATAIRQGGDDAAGTATRSVRQLPRDRISEPPSRRGNAPIGDDGHSVELHHNQTTGALESELTRSDHRLGDNYSRNHPNTGQEPSQRDRNADRNERRRYWREQEDSGRWED